MTLARLLLMAVIALPLGACDKSPMPFAPERPTPRDRPAEIPAADALTLATSEDMQAAPKFANDAAIQKAVDDYLEATDQRWEVVAARDIGDYVLLWISFPEISDGGIDLVYSKKDQQVLWQFLGGYRG